MKQLKLHGVVLFVHKAVFIPEMCLFIFGLSNDVIGTSDCTRRMVNDGEITWKEMDVP